MAKKSQTKNNLNEVSEQFSKVKHKYDTLGINLAQALELFLNENDLKVLSVSNRTKDKDSFVEKIDRKNYENPFDDIEDICGIRIICYYQSDVDKIAAIISKEFEVLENQDKEQLLEADQFGYRSTHFIVKIKKEWLKAPNYRNLENLKAEIQIRTVLMHAWAEIEHKLAYKKKAHIPDKFRRTFYILSAKLEDADKQFEELKNEITKYREQIIEVTSGESKESEDIELNLDSLQTFLDLTFPDRHKSISDTAGFIDQLISLQIGMKEFITAYERVKNYIDQYENEYYEDGKGTRWTQIGIARAIISLTNNSFFEKRIKNNIYRDIDKKWKEIIQKAEAESSE